MIIKEISVHNPELFLFRDSKKYSPEVWQMLLKYLKTNAKAKLLKYEIIQND